MVSAGPVPMPVVVILICLLLAMAIARIAVRRLPEDIRPPAAGMVLDMLLIGLLCGRLSFIATHFASYRDAPASMLTIADGGYHVMVVIGAAFAWVLWRLRRQRRARVPVLAGALVGVLLWAGASQGLASWQAQRMPLPALQMVDLHGAPVDLQHFRGKPLVLNLWASWCGPCRREMPVLAKAQRAHGDVQFVFLNQGETPEEVEVFLADEQIVLGNVLLDAPSAASSTLGVKAFPSTLFFDAQGRLQELHLGELTEAGLEYKLRRLR